jgi:general stress protein YciG
MGRGMMSEQVRAYMAEIGRKGGKVSRRVLTREQSRVMNERRGKKKVVDPMVEVEAELRQEALREKGSEPRWHPLLGRKG